jgi:hypothetical protein
MFLCKLGEEGNSSVLTCGNSVSRILKAKCVAFRAENILKHLHYVIFLMSDMSTSAENVLPVGPSLSSLLKLWTTLA